MPRTIDNVGQYRARHAKHIAQSIVPARAANCHQRGARSIGRVRDMRAACQPKNQIAFDRADREMITRLAQLRPVRQRPADLASREIRIKQETGLSLHGRFVPVRFQLLANRCRAPVLPDNRGRKWLACPPVPENNCFALVGNANACNPVRPACLCHHFARALKR